MDLPELHQRFLDDVLPRIQQDGRITGIAVTGSIAAGEADDRSDVDLLLIVDDADYAAVTEQRLELVASWTPLVVGFTGEHVGEPRLIITLVGPPLLHVDLMFIRLVDLADRQEDPLILFDRDGLLALTVTQHPSAPDVVDLQWIEDRFWVWIHYAATKLGRGELYEVIGFLAFLRDRVFGPMAAMRAGLRPRGVRRLERIDPAVTRELRATLSGYDLREAEAALLACVDIYQRWLEELGPEIDTHPTAAELAVGYLRQVIAS
ncbi:nucleotidyltransferase domain-containing protein [Nakamurella silvestris]|nr:nucleotidyltransferase domain-containing protein [Nakamurella silvestris]